MNRREALKTTLVASAGWWLTNRAIAAPAIPTGRAKAVIQIWMWGGPCHIDTFDPKPNAGHDYCGDLDKDIPTNVDGIRINANLPLLAKQADKFSIIRSLTHGNNAHETASYIVQTGRKAGDGQVWPSAGAVVSYFKGYNGGYKGLIPPYVVLTRPQGRFSEAGFLGNRYKPFATGGDPASRTRFVVEGVVAEGITEERQRARRDLMLGLDQLRARRREDPAVAELERADAQAYDLILGDAGKVFDLSEEKEELRERYGRTRFGQSCLVARRLVERGVPYVTINYEGWDTHKLHFQAMRRMLPDLDRGMATLIEDLHQRGLLDSTIIWWSGEFGRTPRVQWEPPWNGGRNHFGRVFCAVVAGGGFKGGRVVGKTDEKGENLVERPVYPWDLLGTMYALLGIDGAAKLPHPQGKPVTVSPQPDEGYESGGLLTELV
ncbi:MAG: DUF1501 domain-containing protein [Kiritimatiellae bacterium]|nr:DUF1501 domain-containing protein [Kiritimatiellia bacterium]